MMVSREKINNMKSQLYSTQASYNPKYNLVERRVQCLMDYSVAGQEDTFDKDDSKFYVTYYKPMY